MTNIYVKSENESKDNFFLLTINFLKDYLFIYVRNLSFISNHKAFIKIAIYLIIYVLE